MKRSERKSAKADPKKSHSSPSNESADNHDCHVYGNVNIRGVIETEPGPELKQSRTTERHEDQTHAHWVLAVNALTLIAVIIYAGLTWWMGCSTKQAAKATEIAAKAAFNQVQIMQIDEQPWLGVTHQAKPILEINKAPVMEVVVANTGKTPALQIAGNYYVEILNVGEKPHFEAQVAHLKTIQQTMMPPNGSRDEWMQRYRHMAGASVDVGEPEPLTKTEKKALDGGEDYIAIHGLIWYGDKFGKRHWVRFCYWDYLTQGYFDARACDGYNSAGDE
jgi:hypothetical protein